MPSNVIQSKIKLFVNKQLQLFSKLSHILRNSIVLIQRKCHFHFTLVTLRSIEGYTKRGIIPFFADA